MSGGITAGNSRVARIARFLKSNGRGERVDALRVVVREGDESSVLATYGAAQLVPELAADLNALVVDFATSVGSIRKGKFVLVDADGGDVAMSAWEARPDTNALDQPEGDAEFDGSSRSILVELQRHMEANKRMEIAERAQQNQAYQHVIELMGGVVERAGEQLERVTTRLIESESKGDDAREELAELREDMAEAAAEAGDDASAEANAAQVGSMLMKVMSSRQGPKQGPQQAPAPAAPEPEAGEA
jgi:hypothetical protein